MNYTYLRLIIIRISVWLGKGLRIIGLKLGNTMGMSRTKNVMVVMYLSQIFSPGWFLL